ncbi:hypothetical protein D9619_009156 [Psilocybe cf. subviscida]|uniref:NADPH-dependent diflavin oxidoreductase 1 n=1 Tax=Psilocybe cf. subviscida TaxID=2480587 RepID=A0A8H5FAF4_9AGAR|nr:hypothetical protein D9619_009156 [Psilocybe cf. subviscida]
MADEDARTLLILYATETGNAIHAADYIARQCRRIAFQCRVADIETFSLPDLLSETIVLFVVSTTGSGVEPRSMTPLWNNLLRSDLPLDVFEDLYFSVFGLGDTSYEKFCWAAKKLSRRLESLGACEFYARGEGDEQHAHGIDGALQPWTDELLRILLEMFPLPGGLEIIPPDEIPPPRVLLNPVSTLNESQDPLKSDLQYHKGVVRTNERITDPFWYQDVRLFEFDVEDDIQYEPGDVAIINPYASDDDVSAFLSTMHWEDAADEPLSIEQSMYDQSLPDHLPETTTLRILFTRFLDFSAVPRRYFFQMIRHFTTDELEKEKLEDFLTPEGADDLYEYTVRVRRTIWEVLSDFRHVAIPRDYILDVFPALRPREFSIASSIKKHPHQIHLCIAMVKYRTKLKIPRKGVCTSYLSTLKAGDVLRIGLRKGLLRLPHNADTPVICVGPGTGVAPMRAVIEQRLADGAKSDVLYFGCRSAGKDQHFAVEWQKYAESGHLQYRVACSRDGPEGVPRIYVQDLIREDAAQIWDLIGVRKGWVLISGSSNKMPQAVREALSFAVESAGKYPEAQAKKYIHAMETEGRLIEECWD